MTPAQMESMNLTSNWVTGGAQDMMANQNQQYQQMMSGDVNMNFGEGSPYQDMTDVYTQQATDSANQMMGDVRGNQVMSGQTGGSSRGDMVNNQVIEETNQQLSNNLAGMYGDAYSQASSQAANTQLGALGQYDSVMNQPLQQSQALYNQVGMPQQQLNQAIMNDQKDRYDYNANAGAANLAQYGNFIQGDMGGIQTTNQSGSQSGTQTQT
jgi:hypothetical protein